MPLCKIAPAQRSKRDEAPPSAPLRDAGASLRYGGASKERIAVLRLGRPPRRP